MVPLHPLSHLMATVWDQDKLAVSVLSCGGAGNKTTNSLIRGQAVSLIAKIYCET